MAFTGITDPALLFLFPITAREPGADRGALAVPEIERRRANLDRPSWLILDEMNIARSVALFDLERPAPVGAFSATFVVTIAQALKDFRAAGGAVAQIKR